MKKRTTHSLADFDKSGLPTESGVYLFQNAQKNYLYIGKAGNLKKRLSFYFRPKNQRGKIKKIIENSKTISLITTPGEFDALLLEASLIKKYQPKYNVLQKDDKHYLYIAITEEKFPRLKTGRRKSDGITFGPFPSGKTTRLILKEIRKILPHRSCRHLPDEPCLYHNLGLCPAPCVHQNDKECQQEYQQTITAIEKILSGQTEKIIGQYEKKMKKAAQNNNFEVAARAKKIINGLNQLGQKRIDPNLFLADVDLKDTRKGNLEELYQLLNPHFDNLSLPLRRIEGYDIANIKGESATGSMVVFTNGQPDSSQYRRFKIKSVSGANDPAMMAEVIKRRFQHQEWDQPDLVVVDGGKTQLQAAHQASHQLENQPAIIGLAKKEEKIIIKSGDSFETLSPDPNSKPLLLLRALRNEAHRFAQKYYHYLRRQPYRKAKK